MLQYVAVFDARQMGACCPGVGFCGRATQTHFVCVFFLPGEVQTLRPTAPEECAL